MVSGDVPFDFEHGVGRLIQAIKKGDYKPMPEETSKELKDLIKNMLTVNQENRFSAKQCLEHAWFHVDGNKSFDEVSPNLIRRITKQTIGRLRKFRHGSKLRIALLNILVKQIHAEQYQDLDRQFKIIDKDRTGVITREELELVMKTAEIEVEPEELDQIINEIDYEHNGTINYTEFLAATLPVEKFVTEQ